MTHLRLKYNTKIISLNILILSFNTSQMIRKNIIIILPLVCLFGCIEEPAKLTPFNHQDSFTYFKSEQGLPSNEIHSLFEDSKGNLWVGHSLGVSRFNGTQFTNFINPTIVGGAILAIGEDAEGHIWIGSAIGFSEYNGSTWATSTQFGIQSYFLTRSKEFWAGTLGQGAIRVSPNGQQRQFFFNCNNCNIVTDITEDDSGNVWYTTYDGVFIISGNNFKRWAFNIPEFDYFSSVTKDSWGNILVGGLNSAGILRFKDDQDIKDIYNPVGLHNASGLASDFYGGVFITTFENGLLYFDGRVIFEIKTPNADTDLSCIWVDSEGTVWIGTSSNGLIKYQPKTKQM